MSYTITAPSAKVDGVSVFGPVSLLFQKGVASVDEVGEGLAAYLHSAGFTVEEDAAGTEPAQFDPAKSSVDKVLEYLSTVDDAERERVLAAEADGKNRKGIIEGAQDAPEDDAEGDVL